MQFSENYDKSQKVGARVFHVFVEGILAFKGLDIFIEAGNQGNRRIAKTFRVSAVGRNIDIKFVPEKGNPKINTIEILPVSGRPPHPDIQAVVPVEGDTPEGNGNSWADSYSVSDRCYCAMTYDHAIDAVMVETPIGFMSVKQACEMIGPGPGKKGNPIYNDIQCGNGPPNNAGNEQQCPGRVDLGRKRCGHIGPLRFGKEGDDNDQRSSTLPLTPPKPKPTRNRFILNASG